MLRTPVLWNVQREELDVQSGTDTRDQFYGLQATDLESQVYLLPLVQR